MEREQIIKALECCSNGTTAKCEHCPYEKFPSLKDTVALIKELIMENERLKDISCKASARIYELQRELERDLK